MNKPEEPKMFWNNVMETYTNLTLDECKAKYTQISMMPDRFITASNLFPIMVNGTNQGKYDFAIFCKVRPQQKAVSMSNQPQANAFLGAAGGLRF